MTARATFKQADVTRAIAGVAAAGLKVESIEIMDGRIVVHVAEAANINSRRLLDKLHAA